MEILDDMEDLCPICLGPIEKDDDVIRLDGAEAHTQCYREEKLAGRM